MLLFIVFMVLTLIDYVARPEVAIIN
jgi:hypothetical protein